MYPFLFKYRTVHVDPPTVTVYLLIRGYIDRCKHWGTFIVGDNYIRINHLMKYYYLPNWSCYFVASKHKSEYSQIWITKFFYICLQLQTINYNSYINLGNSLNLFDMLLLNIYDISLPQTFPSIGEFLVYQRLIW